MDARKLLLFDIDGTLLTSAGAGCKALSLALAERFAIEDTLNDIQLAGATDSAIARQILAKHQLEESTENISALLDGYLHFLPVELKKRPGRLLPGVLELLDALTTAPSLVLALLTGNLQRGAQIKLTHYGAWDYFEFGAFADDHHLRNELGPFARTRAKERHGIEFPPEHIFIIGDTPKDIECGRGQDCCNRHRGIFHRGTGRASSGFSNPGFSKYTGNPAYFSRAIAGF